MTLITVVAAFTLAVSFLCSTLEATLYSVTPMQLEMLVKQGAFGAKRFARFRTDIDSPIAAILTVNTVANAAGPTALGALVASQLGSAWLGAFTAVFTLAVLFAGEIVPKSIGVKWGRSLVPVLAWPLQVLIWISWPIARPSSWLIRKVTGHGVVHTPTEAEIIAMSKAAGREGQLTELEARWVENVLLLDQVTAWDMMTPRTVVQTVFAEETSEDLQKRAALRAHSRLPVTEQPDDLDKIIGMIHRRDVEAALGRGEGGRPVRELMREIDFVPGGMKGPQLLEKFIRGRKHMVIVADEYGGIEGLVTLEDVIETMLGTEIVDEHDVHVDMQELARRRARRPR